MLQVWCAQINFVNDTLTKTYDQNYDIDAIVSTAVGGLNLDYATDEVGNIKTVLLTNVSFGLEYDKLYRLSHVRDQNAALIEGRALPMTEPGIDFPKRYGTRLPCLTIMPPQTTN